MALGTTNIDVFLVQKTIGVYSTSSVLGLIAKAAKGGSGKWLLRTDGGTPIYTTMAFFLNETKNQVDEIDHAGRNDGTLIPGAEPHWNMWSNKIPAEWYCDAGYGFQLNLRIRRDTRNPNGGYMAHLHQFTEYEHSRVVNPKPDLWVSGTEAWEGSEVSVTARFYIQFLDLSTANRTGGPCTHYMIVFTRNGTDYPSSPMLLDNSDLGVPTHTFTLNASTDLSFKVYLLPTNVDTARVLVPTQFYTISGVDTPSGTVKVRLMYYPTISPDTGYIYQGAVDLGLILSKTWTWSETITEGTARFLGASDEILDSVKVTNTYNPFNGGLKVRFWGNVSGPMKARAYRNGIQIGVDYNFNLLSSAPNYTGIDRTFNFQVVSLGTLSESDNFDIIITHNT